jgi:hypothetical protein
MALWPNLWQNSPQVGGINGGGGFGHVAAGAHDKCSFSICHCELLNSF